MADHAYFQPQGFNYYKLLFEGYEGFIVTSKGVFINGDEKIPKVELNTYVLTLEFIEANPVPTELNNLPKTKQEEYHLAYDAALQSFLERQVTSQHSTH